MHIFCRLYANLVQYQDITWLSLIKHKVSIDFLCGLKKRPLGHIRIVHVNSEVNACSVHCKYSELVVSNDCAINWIYLVTY